MPCDQIRTMTLNMAQLNADLATRALKAMGYVQSQWDKATLKFGDYKTARVEGKTVTLPVEDEPAFRQEYAKVVLAEGARRFGWGLTKKDKGNQFSLKKRF